MIETGSMVAAFMVNGQIQEQVINTKQVNLLVALDEELDFGMTQLIDSIYSKTIVGSLIATKWINAAGISANGEHEQYCQSLIDAISTLAYNKRAAAEAETAAVDKNLVAAKAAWAAIYDLQEVLAQSNVTPETAESLKKVMDDLMAVQ